MRAGRLRHRITISEPANQKNSIGEAVPQWTVYTTAWAAIEPVDSLRYSREHEAMEAIQAQQMVRITMRYQAGITAAMRIEHGSVIYDIQNVLDTKEVHRTLTLDCIERNTVDAVPSIWPLVTDGELFSMVSFSRSTTATYWA